MPPKLGEATLPFQVDLSVPGGHQEASITVVFPRGWGGRAGMAGRASAEARSAARWGPDPCSEHESSRAGVSERQSDST